MAERRKQAKYLKLLSYVVAVVLINIVGVTLFFRVDLTANHIYSLSEVSKQVVSSLKEPLTVNVFFTRNLPAPHNGTERYLRDLLEEYALHANKYFNYRFYDVSPEAEGIDAKAIENRKIASEYGIQPIQIQIIEDDEVKFKNAYMGVALIHGDVIERIPAITSTAGLEYKLTTAIQKMNHKISSLLAMKDRIKVRLYLSDSMAAVAPYMGLPELPKLPETIRSLVERINKKNYNKLDFSYEAPASVEDQNAAADKYNIMAMKWPAIKEGHIPAGQGVIGLVMEHDGESLSLPLLHAIRIPIIGTRYSLTEMEDLETAINDNLEKLAGINEDLGVLASHGALSMRQAPGAQGEKIANFSRMVSNTYNIKNIDLSKESIPESLNSLVIVRPDEPFSDYELYEIDQALMRGTRLILFVDALEEKMPTQQSFGMTRGPSYKPIATGLEKLLAHYGVRIRPSYVLDENCYKQQIPRSMGGGERKIYFAPIIKGKGINSDIDFLKHIKALVAVKASPLELDQKRLDENGITAHWLLSTSDRSWEMKDHINLNPMSVRPPTDKDRFASFPIAYLLEGSFPSYFAGKPVPTRTVDAAQNKENNGDGKPAEKDLSMIQGQVAGITKGKPSKIVVMAASEMIGDNVLDATETNGNSLFIYNIIDAMNGHEDIAVMRSKEQRFNPLEASTPATKTVIKWINIAGLPAIVILFGFMVLLRRMSRKKQIQMMFSDS